MKLLVALFTSFLYLTPCATAKLFSNQFIEFDIPENWACRTEGTAWICLSDNPMVNKETVVVFSAKLKGPHDSLEEYLSYLQTPRNIVDETGKTVESELKYVRQKSILGHEWIDSIHVQSELAGFITRYLATTFEELGILVTYSVDASKWDAYEGMFRHLVDSIKPRRGAEPELTEAAEQPITTLPVGQLVQKSIQSPTQTPQQPALSEQPKADQNGFGFNTILILLAVIIIAIVLLKQTRKKKPSPEELPSEDEEEDLEDEEEEEEDDDDE